MIWNNRTKKKKFSREKRQAIGTLFKAVELFNDIRDTGRIRVYLKKLNTSAKQEAGPWSLIGPREPSCAGLRMSGWVNCIGWSQRTFPVTCKISINVVEY